MKKIAVLLISVFSLSGCLDSGGSSSSDSSGGGGNAVVYNSALNAKTQSLSASYRLVKLDGTTPIDDSEDSILVCGSDMSWCKQTCISIYRPVTRWSTFQSSWLSPSGKCVGAAMSYSDGITIPRFKYWIGTFIFNSGSSVLGHCSFNLGSPDFEGKAYFDFVRGAPSYYVQNFFDLSDNAVSNMQLLTFNPPGIYSYHDSSVSNSDITLQLTNSGGCVKEANIGNTFQ